MRIYLLLILLLSIPSIVSCGNSQTLAGRDSQLAVQPAGLARLPTDGVQPWEKVDSKGFVVPNSDRSASAFSTSSHFAEGVERFTEGGDVVDNGEASTITAAAGSGSVSYALYRFTMGGVQPSAIAVDANLLDTGAYWVGVSDYANNIWQWHGPYTEAQVVFTLDSGNYLSALGNTFIAIAAYDGVQLDVVGVTVSPLDGADITAPPAPAAPSATAVAGGIELSWTDVIAADLAGYRIYWSYSPFAGATDNGVKSLPWLENTTRMVLPVKLSRDVYFALSAVDVNSNESGLSAVQSEPHVSGVGQIEVQVSSPQVSVLRGDALSITASGADLYDFDTDGDGIFDITGSASGSAGVDTNSTGIIRPRVRGTNTGGTSVAFGSVSLIVTGNQRPVANAQVTPSFGPAPLNVAMNGTGEDFDGTIAEYAWDFDGDGVFDHNSAVDGVTAENYVTPGLYNAKLHVTDDQGAWDVDTLAVQVTDAGGGALLTALPAVVTYGEATLLAASPDNGDEYEWDLDDNGTFEFATGTDSTFDHILPSPGLYTVTVRITLPGGSQVMASALVRMKGWIPAEPRPDDGLVGTWSSLEVVNGNPAICYDYNDQLAAHDLKFVRATNADGTAWGTPVMVDPNGARTTSMAVVAGNPAISYYDFTNGDLMFTRATDANGTAWDPPTILDGLVDDVGEFSTLLIIVGNPAISYYDKTNGNLRYIRAGNADGSIWGPPQDVDFSLDDVGRNASMAVIAGSPAIAYFDQTNEGVLYVRATHPTGALWGTPNAILPGVGLYTNISMTELSSLPIVAIQNTDATADMEGMVIARSLTLDGAQWIPQLVDTVGEQVAACLEIKVFDGRAVVAYMQSIGELAYLRAATADASTWHQPEPIGGFSFVTSVSLELVNGKPAVTFGHLDFETLSYGLAYWRQQ